MKGAKKWEDGRLGESESHARLVPEASAALDDAMELQLISIRLQKSLIDNLKTIPATNSGVSSSGSHAGHL